MHIVFFMVQFSNTVRTTVTLPKGLPQRAHRAGVNISATAAMAVLREVKKAERETGEPVKTAPAVTPSGAT